MTDTLDVREAAVRITRDHKTDTVTLHVEGADLVDLTAIHRLIFDKDLPRRGGFLSLSKGQEKVVLEVSMPNPEAFDELTQKQTPENHMDWVKSS